MLVPNTPGQQNQAMRFQRILVIDDSPEDRALYRHMLEHAPERFQVFEADTMEEGLRLNEARHPDCILLDYRLPDSDGITFLKAANGNGSGGVAPVIMVTGQGDERTAVEAMKKGAQDYLSKSSLSAEKLVTLIGNAIEKHALKQKVEQYQKDLRQSHQELRDFAHTVSHDLKSPLRKMISYCEMIEEEIGGQANDTCLGYMQRMKLNARRMQELIDDLLSFAESIHSSEKKVSVDTNKLLADIAEDMDSLLKEKNGSISLGALPEIQAYPVLLRQIFLNLVSNALKYSGGNIPRIEISAVRDGRNYIFSVRDNGIGIPEAYQEKIFIPFSRLHAADDIEGTGLGLAICWRAVDRHGGKIWAESRPGQGTTIHFTIPA